ncbi:20587_t:CDS:2 [Funneliformis geosporum]|uniref:919_t:CDS:1 n=1 Tax=Funneliformis geosporum TaxID=1117311 RepID=A0A9W4WKA6_9GLOM|nr:919_t:CDS:2 [Funneliformis geosporum]CAI2167965.1 20587_t:CDS:2 [Funneliformis geosporum]
MEITNFIVNTFLILSIQFLTAFPLVDKPFDNDQITNVYPSMTPIGTNSINMTFSRAVESTIPVNISIYQKLNERNILRQRFLCFRQNCVIGDDENSLTINLLNITFNVPNATYFVEIDDAFLKYKGTDEMISGIKLGTWVIKTTGKYNKTNDDSEIIYGTIRITIEGTKYYKNLTDSKKDFNQRMIKQISESIPVDLLRLNHSRNYFEFDKDEKKEHLYMIFRIDPPKYGFNNKTAQDVFDDFVKLSKINSDIQTYLDLNNYTKFIDKTFTPRKSSNLQEKIKINLLNLTSDKLFLALFICSLVSLIVLTLFGYIINKRADKAAAESAKETDKPKFVKFKNLFAKAMPFKVGKNHQNSKATEAAEAAADKKADYLILFKVAFTFFDMFNDVNFLYELKDNLHDLLYPSIIFTFIPFLVNFVMAIIILLKEIRNNEKEEFNNWFKNNNSYLVTTITVFCIGDIGLLRLLDSRFANLELFKALFQEENLINWGRFINLMIEDIPQFVIQILYVTAITTEYNSNVALLTLISSFIMILINAVFFGLGMLIKHCSNAHK